MTSFDKPIDRIVNILVLCPDGKVSFLCTEIHKDMINMRWVGFSPHDTSLLI